MQLCNKILHTVMQLCNKILHTDEEIEAFNYVLLYFFEQPNDKLSDGLIIVSYR